MPIAIQIGLLFLMSIIANTKVLISGKARVNSTLSALAFNSVVFLVVGSSFLFFIITSPPSPLTLVTAALYAVTTVVFQMFYVVALEKGPISIVVLITNFSTILTAIAGTLLFNEGLRYTSVIGLVFIIISLLLTTRGGEQKKDNKGIIYAFIAMLGSAAAALVQRYHQKTEFAAERNGFLCVAYLFAAAITLVCLLLMTARKGVSARPTNKKIALFGLATGVVLAAYQFMFIYLSGKASSMLMYPALSGFTMSINIIMCRIFFGERPSLRQSIGLVSGMAAVVIIAI